MIRFAQDWPFQRQARWRQSRARDLSRIDNLGEWQPRVGDTVNLVLGIMEIDRLPAMLVQGGGCATAGPTSPRTVNSPPSSSRPEVSLKELLRHITPRPLWRQLQRLKRWREDAPYRMLERQGWVAARKDDFYSPLPVKERLLANKARWYRPSRLQGVSLDLDEMKALWRTLNARFAREYDVLPPYDEVMSLGLGVGFTRADARTLYYMMRHLKPRRYIEVGSGVSTHYTDLARAANSAEGAWTEITCIDPYPYPALQRLGGVRIIAEEVQDVPLDEFRSLGAGDVLFIDSSHAAKIDSDVNFLMMEVVPALARDVYVHIHDVPFPYNFPFPPELYIFPKQWPMYWNEPVVVQAFLQFNNAFHVVLSLSYVQFHDGQLIRETVPEVDDRLDYANVIGSLWIRRTKG
jgi:hypothetical protein